MHSEEVKKESGGQDQGDEGDREKDDKEEGVEKEKEEKKDKDTIKRELKKNRQVHQRSQVQVLASLRRTKGPFGRSNPSGGEEEGPECGSHRGQEGLGPRSL